MRFTDNPKNVSFGVLYGKVLPQNEKLASKTWFLGIIIDGTVTRTSGGKLMDYDCFPSPNQVRSLKARVPEVGAAQGRQPPPCPLTGRGGGKGGIDWPSTMKI